MTIYLDGKPFVILQNQAELNNPRLLQERLEALQKALGKDIVIPTAPSDIQPYIQQPLATQVLFAQMLDKLGERIRFPTTDELSAVLNPETRKIMTEMKKPLDNGAYYSRIGGLVALALAVALTVIGLFSLFSGVVGIVVGIALIAVSLPIFYAGYNTFMISKNLADLRDNILFFYAIMSSPEKLKTAVCKKTILFGYVADKLLATFKPPVNLEVRV